MDKKRYIWLNGEKIPVNEKLYREYYRPEWREAKQKATHAENECSYEQILENGYDLPADDELVEDIVTDKLLLDELYVALAELSDDEQALIDALYHKDRSVRDYAKALGTNHTKIIRQHKSVLEKLREILKNYK